MPSLGRAGKQERRLKSCLSITILTKSICQKEKSSSKTRRRSQRAQKSASNMPFKSKAQIRKFYELHRQGKIGSGTIAEWAMHTKSLKSLPERVKRKKK